MFLGFVNKTLNRDTHLFGKISTRGIVLHNTSPGVVLAVPDDFVGGSLEGVNLNLNPD